MLFPSKYNSEPIELPPGFGKKAKKGTGPFREYKNEKEIGSNILAYRYANDWSLIFSLDTVLNSPDYKLTAEIHNLIIDTLNDFFETNE